MDTHDDGLAERLQRLGEAAAAAAAAGEHAAARERYDALRAAVEDAGLIPHPHLLISSAAASLALGDVDRAERAYVEACALAASHGGPAFVADAEQGLAFCAQHRGAWEQAHAHRQAAAEGYEAAGIPLAAVRVRVDDAGVAYLSGDLRRARRGYEAALADLRVHASAAETSRALANLGGVLLALGQPHEAKAALDEAFALGATQDLVSEGQLRLNRGYAALSVGAFAVAGPDLERAAELSEAAGDWQRVAEVRATLTNLRRYEGDIWGALREHEAVMALEAAHGVTVSEPGGLLYAAIEDHSIEVGTAEASAERIAAGGRQMDEADTTDTVRSALAHVAATGRRPFLLVAPTCPGTWGPLFPRGATAVASYLNHHGVPAVVLPLSHFVDPFLGEEVARERTREVIEDAVRALSPRAIGLSVTFSFLYPAGLELARFARAAAGPDVPIVIGGPHVTYYDTECLAEAPEIDVVVRGEGEWTALELLRALDAGRRHDLGDVQGITWRAVDGTVVRNRLRPLGNVLELPEVDFDLLPRRFARRMEISGVTSRGCAFRCRYCHEFRFWGGTVRQYPARRVLREMERVAVDLGNTMAGIDDSMLSMGEPYFEELCDLLGASPHLPERFGFLTRVDTITAPGLAAMKRNRIRGLAVGLESGSDVVIEAMNKGISTAQALASLALVRDAGVRMSGFFIVGHPGDDVVESEKTLRFLDHLFTEDLIDYVDAATFTPYPGTPFWAHPDKHGVEILTRDWTRWRRSNRPVSQLRGYSANEIFRTYLRMYEVMQNHRRRDR